MTIFPYLFLTLVVVYLSPPPSFPERDFNATLSVSAKQPKSQWMVTLSFVVSRAVHWLPSVPLLSLGCLLLHQF